MKRLFAALTILWYLISTMGLDIHRDNEHGKTYVVPAVLAQSCEMIHPHEHCHDGADHHGEGCCEEDEDCCTDDFESVSITGTDTECQQMQHFQMETAFTIYLPLDTKPALPPIYKRASAKWPPQAPRDISALNCVMRA